MENKKTVSAAGRRFFRGSNLALVFLLCFLLAACVGSRPQVDSPDRLYRQAEEAFQKEKFGRASELYQTIQNEFPDSEYSLLALLRNADIFYCRKDLEEAARAYNDFLNFNPDHPKAPYAKYQVGMSYYVTLKTIDLDLEALRQALKIFEEALAEYPDSPPYTAKIIQRINDCKRKFAKREFYVGFFYYKRGRFGAAIQRFKHLLANYPGFIDDKAMYYLGLAELNQGDQEAGHRSLLTLSQAFPDSPYADQARPWLDKDEKPGLPLVFMARDYFLVHDYDIGDNYLTTRFQPSDYAPRLFNLLAGGRKDGGRRQAVTFASLYRPTGETTPLPEPGKVGPGAAPEGSASRRPELPAPPESDSRPATVIGAPGSAPPAAVAAPPGGRQDEPLEIISDWTEADRLKGTVTFGGKVIAKQKDMVLYADQVVNYFDMKNRRLVKAVATGKVKLNQADKFVTCERAELTQAERKVTLTGNAVMWQGDNRVTGERIVIYLNDSQAEVFGGAKGGKAKVRVVPGEK